jgi:hypothetical protein
MNILAQPKAKFKQQWNETLSFLKFEVRERISC